MEEITYSEKANPRTILKRTLDAVTTFLKSLFANPYQHNLSYQVDIQHEIVPAFDDVMETNYQRCLADVVEVDDDRLTTLGLNGTSLKAKVKGLNELSGLMKRGVRKAVIWLLSLINSVLGSIGKFTLFVDAITELKDLFESTTDLIQN